MKSFASIMTVAGICALSSAAAAESGVEVGVRAGYTIPLGTSVNGGELGDIDFNRTIDGATPLGLDVSYRLAPMFAVGLYGQYGFGFLPKESADNCENANFDCSISDIRAGLQATYIAQLKAMEAWLGVTLGLDRIATQLEGITFPVNSIAMTLPEFGVQGGVGFKVTPTFSIGPFASLSFGRFSYGHLELNGEERHMHVPSDQRRFHEWLTLGVRGSFTP